MYPFVKMQGLGNDFVVMDATKQPITLTAALIQQMANRRLGVGFDQLLLVEPAQDPACDFFFRIYNADGSEAGQCGNGARCMAVFIQRKGLSTRTDLRLQTITSQVQLRIVGSETVQATLEAPRFQANDIPFQAEGDHEGNQLYHEVKLPDETVRLSVVNVGNPHAVIVVDALACDQVHRVGEALSRHPAFPEGVNVGFMQVADKQLVRLRVFERGTGETLACGSGACAAMVVGRRNGLLQERVTVNQPGGDLMIDWQGPGLPIQMTGPAKWVFEGVWN
ncbi:MAG: diaminopimelate epimerase [Gammaproteobacteria bacterium RIFCSPHIGHO2_12_FULL_45_9]|nr:MAG: diaminopimelate epimerase [Gammaproteobacteria bacterium RIFCSPHIGHO2_12_FULL_45_9]